MILGNSHPMLLGILQPMLTDATPKALQEQVYQQVRAVLDAPDLKTARLLKDAFVEAHAEKAPKAVQVLEDGFDDVTAVLVLPERYRRRLRTTTVSNGSTKKFGAASASFGSSPTGNRRSVCSGRY
ncbi:Transposase, Mutator family [Alicyclobacillus vulcanalis]|uniref:Transposase, Mutator family n=1 Tax=Alicyclobacillus vulcanalis TaxID=252246 RepID=A0A1N7PY94_9BACL|nr:Transposase, Mutator family [Alicyclobacillus vulcanalis]